MNSLNRAISNLKKRKGFTLIELIVVIVVIGVLAAIIIPRYSDFRLRSAMKSDIANARIIATAASAMYAEDPTNYNNIVLANPDFIDQLSPGWTNTSSVDNTKTFLLAVADNGTITITCGGENIFPNFTEYSAAALTW